MGRRKKKSDDAMAIAAIIAAIVAIVTFLFFLLKLLWLPFKKKDSTGKAIGFFAISGMILGLGLLVYGIAEGYPVIKGHKDGQIVQVNSEKGGNIRDSASINAEVLMVAKLADIYQLAGAVGDWFKIVVVHNNYIDTGFVHKYIVTVNDGQYPIYEMVYENMKAYAAILIAAILLYFYGIFRKSSSPSPNVQNIDVY